MSIFLASGDLKGLDTWAMDTGKKLETKEASWLTAESMISE